ncbi:MAG TPA: hypothetical protein VFJ16_04490 [Longimicrobium sp.]|nr:hypothetical protein [Longimicrobium sp.]
MKKLNLDHLQVSSFEPAPPPAREAGAKEKGTVYGFSGQYGPACRSEPPNCNDNTLTPWWY